MDNLHASKPRRILVIDDNRSIHEDFRKILGSRHAGNFVLDEVESELFGDVKVETNAPELEIDSAYQGQEALVLVRTALEQGRPYAMAFVDVRMPPGMDGIETTAELWKVDPNLQIVICTAYSDHSWDEMLETLGTSDRLLILKKPFDNIEALQLANALTEKCHLARQAQYHVEELERRVQARTQDLSIANEQLRQTQKMEAIGRLAGGVAHDFNNLLTAIIGYCDLVRGQLDPHHPAQPDLEEIDKAGKRAASLTSQLLAFSRKQILQPKVLDLNNELGEIEKMLRRLIGEDVELTVNLDPSLWQVRADPGQIEQVIMNLVINARDAMPGGGKLTIETKNVILDQSYTTRHITTQPGPHVMLAMSDTGIGMDKETQSRIFEPFFTTKAQGKGTGLGLSTVYGIVKQSGGSIWIYSEPNKGTTFKIYFPRVEGSPERIEHHETPIERRAGGERVLLVEDDELVRKFASQVLRKNGHTVHEAATPHQALSICQQEQGRFDLLISDVVMPGMDGRQLAEQLASLRPEIKVLFMSGYTDDAIVQHGMLDPDTAFIQKPFRPEALMRKIHEVLSA